VAGISVGALTHIVPMYIAEIAPASIRGSLVALQQLAITLGVSKQARFIKAETLINPLSNLQILFSCTFALASFSCGF